MVGSPAGALEAEADRAAEAAVRGDPAATRPGAAPRLSRATSADAGQGEGEAPPIVAEVLATPGRPLDGTTRAAMERRFGHDFGQVRVHTDARAAESARAVQARAYTVGSHIVFDSGQYAPRHGAGLRLLAHELAHTVQQGGAPAMLQRACLPSAVCPPIATSLGGGGLRWEAAELCLQNQYRSSRPGLIGTNKSWTALSAPLTTAAGRDLDCFKSHLAAKSGMFLAQPDIIDFTRAQIYDVTTPGQAPAHRVRLWADTGEATALSAIPDCGRNGGASRKWEPGDWSPSPCYALGGDLYMRAWNDNGLLLYDMLKDLTKEAILALLLAAAYSQFKNPMQKLGAKVLARNPYVAAGLAAATILVVLTTDAEIAFAAEGDPISNILKAIENSGVETPDAIKEALKSNPALRERLEAAMKDAKTPSDKAKAASNAMLKLIAEHKDQFSQEDLEAIVSVLETTGGKVAETTMTVEQLRARLDQIKRGEVKDPGAEAQGAPGAGGATGQQGQAALKPETLKKLEQSGESVRRLLERVTAKTGPGTALTDAQIERFLAIVPPTLTQAQIDAIAGRVQPGQQQTPDQMLDELAKAVAAEQAKTEADLAKQHPALKPETLKKLAAAPELVRRLFDEMTGAVSKTAGKELAVTDEVVERFLAILGTKLTAEQYEALAARLSAVKPGETAKSVLDKLEKAVAETAKPQGGPDKGEKPGGDKGGKKSGGKGGPGKKGPAEQGGVGEKGKDAVTSEQLRRQLAEYARKFDYSQVERGAFRLFFIYDVNYATVHKQAHMIAIFGLLEDGTKYVGICEARFTAVQELKTTMTVITSTDMVDENANVIFEPSDWEGSAKAKQVALERIERLPEAVK